MGDKMRKTREIAKKVIIIYVLNIIKAYSSEDAPVSQSAISNYLNDIDVPCDRKTVGRNIEYLIEFGYPIKKVAGKGYYLREQDIAALGNKLII